MFQVTLESGLGHRTVPLLLAESSFNGLAKNWSSLLQLRGEVTLEVSAEAAYVLRSHRNIFNTSDFVRVGELLQ